MFSLLSLQLIQVFQSRQDDLFTRLFNLSSEKDFIEYSIDLVEVEDEIQLANIAEELVQHFDEEMYSLEIGEFVVVRVDTDTEEQARVPPVDNLRGRQVLAHKRLIVGGRCRRAGCRSELDEVGLVFLIAGSDETVDLMHSVYCLLAVTPGLVPRPLT